MFPTSGKGFGPGIDSKDLTSGNELAPTAREW